MENKKILRGDIWYVLEYEHEGSEPGGGHPAIIVSNDANNLFSSTVEVVYLTTARKKDLPTHTEIRSAPRVSTALCEQVDTISKNKLERFVGTCTDAEMEEVEKKICVSLGIRMNGMKQKDEDLIRAEAEKDIYKDLYMNLLRKLEGRGDAERD